MKNTFLRSLALGAVVQFFVTRQRAGNVIEEGEAEALWLRYPFIVVRNAIFTTLAITAVSLAVRRVRRAL